MRSLFILVFCIGALQFCNAQIDRPNNSFAIPAEEVKDPKADNALDIKAEKEANEIIPEETADNKVIATKPKLVSKKPEKPFSIVETNNFKNPA
uniref:hypothetical protein n=1 Tax=Aurantibacter sp. TaxID=2807103 RepID=UPI0035C7B890